MRARERTDALLLAVVICVLAVLVGVFRYVWRMCLLGASRRVEQGLRDRLFSHLQTLSAAYFDRTRTGDLMAHATNDIQQSAWRPAWAGGLERRRGHGGRRHRFHGLHRPRLTGVSSSRCR